MSRPSQSPCLVNISPIHTTSSSTPSSSRFSSSRSRWVYNHLITRPTGRGCGKSRSANHIGGNAKQQLESFQVNFGQSHEMAPLMQFANQNVYYYYQKFWLLVLRGRTYCEGSLGPLDGLSLSRTGGM